MELKELSAKILQLFGADSPQAFPQAVRDIVFSPNATSYYDRYLELCPDLSVDWLQRIYQFYCADRTEKKQDYTPVSLARMVAFLTYSPGEKTAYDCCAGSGSLSIQKWSINKELSFVCEELDANVIPILLFNLCLRNIQATIHRKDILSGEVYESYQVRKGNRYGAVHKLIFPDTGMSMSDSSVSNPPFNLRIPVCADLSDSLPDKYTCNFVFVAHCLQRSERYAALILPRGVLTSKEEADCRKFFVEKGWLKAAISLPEKMFESTQTGTCILLFDKEKKSKDVMLVNAERMSSVEVREQRGEGDASHYNRIYRKQFNTFSDEQIAAVCELTEKEQSEYSKRVSYEELETHGWGLAIGPYLPIMFEGTLHRDFNAIIADINRIIRERNVLKLTVNKVWAKNLGLEAVIEECNASNEVVKAINQSLQLFSNYEFKEKILESRYIASSNSKVFLIENTDKEILSSIMPFFMNMYKQHIYYLNNEENRLLGELRDAMLPYLMNGMLEMKGGATI